MKKILLFFLLFCSSWLNAQSVDVQIVPDLVNSDEQYCILLQVQSSDGADFLGNSSIYITYDDNVVLFEGSSTFGINTGSYESINFDFNDGTNPNDLPNEECLTENGGIGFSPYAEQGFDGLTPGNLLTTFVLLNQTVVPSFVPACPSIANDWETVAQVCFEVLDPNGNPDFQFVGDENSPVTNTQGTNFNPDSNDPADKYNNGDLIGLETPFASLSEPPYIIEVQGLNPYICSDAGDLLLSLLFETTSPISSEIYLVNEQTNEIVYPEFNYFDEDIQLFLFKVENYLPSQDFNYHFNYPDYSGSISAYTYDFYTLSSQIQKLSLGETSINTPIINGNLSTISGDYTDFTIIDVPNHSFQHGVVAYDEENGTFDYYPPYDFEGTDEFYFRANVIENEFNSFEALFKVSIEVGNFSASIDPADYGSYDVLITNYNSNEGFIEIDFDFYLNPEESYTFSIDGGSPFLLPQENSGIFTFSTAQPYFSIGFSPIISLEEPFNMLIENTNDPSETYEYLITEAQYAPSIGSCYDFVSLDTLNANAFTTNLLVEVQTVPFLYWRPCGSTEWNFYDNIAGTGNDSLIIEVPSDGWGYCFEFATTDADVQVFWETASSSDYNFQSSNFNAKVFLEGPYDNNGTMLTNLGDLIPIEQPFNELPYAYSGSENIANLSSVDLNEVVDWVLVELRVGSPSLIEKRTQVVENHAGLLLSNGDIVSTDLVSPLQFNELLSGQQYHFCIRQRNHLDIFSAVPHNIDIDNNYDFTVSDGSVLGLGQLKQMPDGNFAMHTADFTGEGVIQTSDYDAWFALPAALEVYAKTDANLDGVIQVTDYDFWFDNKAKIGTPEIRYE